MSLHNMKDISSC